MNAKRKQVGIILAAFALTSVSMGKMIVIAGFSDFSREFESIPLVSKQLLISISSLSGIPVALLLGRMERYISPKKLALVASGLFAIGGLIPIYTGNFELMFIARCIMGFGMAMCSTLSTSIVVEHFTGSMRTKLIGYCSAVKSLFGVGFSYFGGVLATRSWRSAYWIYLLGFVVFAVVLLCLPDKGTQRVSLGDSRKKSRQRLSKTVWYYSFAAMLMFVFFSAHGNNISLLFENYGIGTAMQAGVASALFTVGGFLSGLVFHRIYKRMIEYTQVLGYLFAGFSLLMMSLGGSYGIICVESFIFGLGFYMIIPHQTLLVTASVSKEAYTLSAALHLSAMNLGQVLSPMILNRLSNLCFGEGVLGRYRVAGIGLLAMAAIAVIRVLKNGRETQFSQIC